MGFQRKHIGKAQKVSNIIEEQKMPNEKQVIIVYVAPPSQGILSEVHFEFAYGHIRYHPYFPCKNKDGFFCQFFLLQYLNISNQISFT